MNPPGGTWVISRSTRLAAPRSAEVKRASPPCMAIDSRGATNSAIWSFLPRWGLRAVGALGRSAWILGPRYAGDPPAKLGLISVACYVLAAELVYRGIQRCYRTNCHIDGRSFFERCVLLTLPPSVVTVCTLLAMTLAVLVVALGTLRDDPHVQESYPGVLYAFGPLGVAAFYWLANHSFIRFGKLLQAEE